MGTKSCSANIILNKKNRATKRAVKLCGALRERSEIMKKHTKIVALFLAVLMMLSLSACGKKLSVGDSLQMGNYGENSIWWEVIAVDGDRALVISRDSVDWKLFNEQYENVTWETSTLRNWLNDTFYNSAFNSDERSKILTTTIENPDNPDSGVDGGNDTEDRLFLLSVYEVEEYYEREAFREAGLSIKAHNSAKEYNPDGYIGGLSSSWWTRTPGEDEFGFICVNGGGEFETRPTGLASDLFTSGIVVADDKNGAGVRPAMWIER